jgi:hypothetical protein
VPLTVDFPVVGVEKPEEGNWMSYWNPVYSPSPTLIFKVYFPVVPGRTSTYSTVKVCAIDAPYVVNIINRLRNTFLMTLI